MKIKNNNPEKALIYQLLGLQDPDEFRHETIMAKINSLFEQSLRNDNYLNYYSGSDQYIRSFILNKRQTGKTTDLLIDAYCLARDGSNVAVVCLNKMSETATRLKYQRFYATLKTAGLQETVGVVYFLNKDNKPLRGVANLIVLNDLD